VKTAINSLMAAVFFALATMVLAAVLGCYGHGLVDAWLWGWRLLP
jgi:hypothetical protein